MEKMILKEPSIEYENQLYEYIEEHEKYNSHMNGSGGLNRYKGDIVGYLDRVKKEKEGTYYESGIPAETYMLIREDDNKLIGMINIRLGLDDNLRRCGGHIGYGIRPTMRRRGYNKINLYLGIKKCLENGINMILLDCEYDNEGSYRTMEALGGELIQVYEDSKHGKCRKYLIDGEKAVRDYGYLYEGKEISNESNRGKKIK